LDNFSLPLTPSQQVGGETGFFTDLLELVLCEASEGTRCDTLLSEAKGRGLLQSTRREGRFPLPLAGRG